MSNLQIRAFENLKRLTDEALVIAQIKAGRLPYEVVVPAVQKTTPAIWAELLRQAPYQNLLRSLATFARHDVFKSEENVAYAVAKLTNPRAVEKSRVLPFRFFNAWKAYSASDGADNRIADAIRQALELSFVNLPSFGKRTVAIGSDTSGSMGSQIHEKSQARYIDVCGIFTGALMKKCEGRVIPLPFDTVIHADHSLSGRDDILVTAEKMSGYGGGGTAVGAPVQHLLDRKIPVDVFIGITDAEDWCHGYDGWYGAETRASFLEMWREYRKLFPAAVAFLVTIAPYQDRLAPAGEPGVHFISGWSDSVLKYIGMKLETGSGQIEDIMRMEISAVGSSEEESDESEEDVE